MRYVLQIRLRVCRMVVNAICILQSFGVCLRFETETGSVGSLVRESFGDLPWSCGKMRENKKIPTPYKESGFWG